MTKYLIISILGVIISQQVDAGIKTDPIKEALYVASVLNNVAFRHLSAICFIESRHNPKAINKHDNGSPSYGLCQIKFKTARFVGFSGHASDLFNPNINAFYAAKYLRYQLDRYRGDWKRAISAYNMGHAGLGNKKYVERVIHYARWGIKSGKGEANRIRTKWASNT